MKILSEEMTALRKRNCDISKTAPSYVLIDSGTCRMPAVSYAKVQDLSPRSADMDYMSEVYAYPLEEDAENVGYRAQNEGRIVNMRIDIKRRVRQPQGVNAPPSSPTNNREFLLPGTKAPPSTPITSMTNIGSNLGFSDPQNGDSENDEFEYQVRNKSFSRNRSAPPSMSQYRTRILSSTSPWIKKRAVVELSNTRSQTNIGIVAVERPSTSVRPFSEREDQSDSDSNLSRVRILPPSSSSRVPMPDFGSFRGRPPISVTTRTFSRQKRVLNDSQTGRDSDSMNYSKLENANSNQHTNFSGSKIDQYVSELRKTMKSSRADKNSKRLKPFTVWAASNSSIESSNQHANETESNNESSSTWNSSDDNSHSPSSMSRLESENQSPTLSSKSQAHDPNSVRQEIIRQIVETTKDVGKEEEKLKNFLEVKGDSPPRNIRKSFVEFEPGSEKCDECGGSNRDFPPTKSRVTLSTSAMRGTMRYAKQFGMTKMGNGSDVRSVTCYHNNATRTVRMPSYVEFRVINRNRLYEQTLPLLKLKIHPPRLLSYGNGCDVTSQPFARNLIGKTTR